VSSWRRLADLVAAEGRAALVTVHRVRGSAPREEGARLIVRPDGAFHGTIGGGRLEWEALRLARAALVEARPPARFVEQVLGPDLGQCCGGVVTLLVETFELVDLAEIEALAAAEEVGAARIEACLGEDGWVRRALSLPPLRGRVAPALAGVGRGGAAFAAHGEADSARSEFSASRAPAAPPHPPFADAKGTFSRRGEKERARQPEKHWTEPLGPIPTSLLLFGAGHVGRALVLALAPLPFRVRWIDSRDEAFPAYVTANVAPVRADDPAAEIGAAPPGAFVLVMTHDHALDLSITAAALGRPDLPFVGLIGSATKRARFVARLRNFGMPEARIAALACPIGVPGIASKEPAIIAAATAAQLLAERERVAAAVRGHASSAA
jgi:xanthine dehydrogenase accessory factor